MEKQEKVITYLLDEKIVNTDSLSQYIEDQQSSGKSLIHILKDKDLLDEQHYSELVAVSQGIEFINLSPDMVNPMAAYMVTNEFANRYNLIPIKLEDGNLTVAMSEPLNLDARDKVEVRTGYKVIPVAATPSAIKQSVRYHFNVKNVTRQAIASMRLKADKPKSSLDEMDSTSARVANDPITKLVSSVIISGIDASASDIHIEPQEPDIRVRYRIDGLLRDALSIPSSVLQEVVSHIKILSGMDISERRIPQDGHIRYKHEDKEYDLRVSSLPSTGGEKIVMRILDKSSQRWALEDVVTSTSDITTFKDLIKNPYGMLLLTGPTGSGKTTTLYSLLQLLNTPDKNIVTVEDPVEYKLDGITQIQINTAAGLTFAKSLRSILRQDPDIILIGEIRDLETAEIAVSAALTGHLVLSTLHTNDAAGAISRMVNIGVPPFLVASSLLGTVAQRLIRTTCERCGEEYGPDDDELAKLKGHGQVKTLSRGKGCNSCYYTGYHGRKSIYEILQMSNGMRKMIINGAGDDQIKELAIAEGMQTLRKSGIDNVIEGRTTLDELGRVVDMKEI